MTGAELLFSSSDNSEPASNRRRYEVLCRKTLGFVDLPDAGDGRVKGGRIDATNLYLEHKQKWMLQGFPPGVWSSSHC